MEEEIRKCKESPIYFIETYLRLFGKRIELSEEQKNLITSMKNLDIKYDPPLGSIDGKGKGRSFATSCFILWRCLFFSDQRVCIFGNYRNIYESNRVFNMVKNLYFSLPEELQDKGSYFSEKSANFSNESFIEVCNNSKRIFGKKYTIMNIPNNNFISLDPRMLWSIMDELRCMEIVSSIDKEGLVIIS